MINTEEIISHTSQLVAIPSVADNPNALRQAVDFVADFVAANSQNVTIERFEQNGVTSFLAYKGTIRPSKFDIILNGHVDVVPGAPELFVPRVENGRLYGRGVLDMKGTTMVLASIFCELVNEAPYALGLQIVSDEESGGYDGAHYHIKRGIRTDFAIMGEYSNHRDAIYNAARGLCWVEVAFKGKTAHGGHPWKGDNAVVKASAFIEKLLAFYPIPSEETWTTTATISSLSTPNMTYNQIPDYAVVKVDFRFTKNDEAFQSEETVKEFIRSLDREAEVIDISTFGSSVHAKTTNPYVKGLARAMANTTDIEPRFMARPGSSDGRHFAAVDIECVEFGLYGFNAHSDGEYVELDSFDEYAAILRAYLKQPKA